MNYLNYIISKIVYGGGIFFDLAKWLIVILVTFIIINTFFVAVFVVDGASMEPNLHDRELVLWNKHAYTASLPEKNDVVVVNYPGDPNKRKYVKRVIALPGEQVKIKAGKVYIDGELLEEDFLPENLETEPSGTWTLGEDQYFVMGDNRPNSNDSRYFGPVELRFILGKSISIIYPRFRLIKDI